MSKRAEKQTQKLKTDTMEGDEDIDTSDRLAEKE